VAIDLAFRRRATRNTRSRYRLLRPLRPRSGSDLCRAIDRRHTLKGESSSDVGAIGHHRQVDVREIAWVWASPVADKTMIGPLEEALFHHFHAKSALMNGKAPSDRRLRRSRRDPLKETALSDSPVSVIAWMRLQPIGNIFILRNFGIVLSENLEPC
jgi:hypothetical protein